MIRPECHYYSSGKVWAQSKDRICVSFLDLGNKVELACELSCVAWVSCFCRDSMIMRRYTAQNEPLHSDRDYITSSSRNEHRKDNDRVRICYRFSIKAYDVYWEGSVASETECILLDDLRQREGGGGCVQSCLLFFGFCLVSCLVACLASCLVPCLVSCLVPCSVSGSRAGVLGLRKM